MSVAEQETVVVPIGKVEPDGGVHVTGSVPSPRSVAEALKVTTAPLALVADTVMFAGTVTTGGVVYSTDIETVSTTVIVSFTPTERFVSGGGGGVLVPLPLSESDWVKFEPDAALAKLLRSALSVNVIVPAGEPEDGAT